MSIRVHQVGGCYMKDVASLQLRPTVKHYWKGKLVLGEFIALLDEWELV